MSENLGVGGEAPQTILYKHNYKITPPILHEIINLISSGVTNDNIVRQIRDKYLLSLSSTRISQIRNRLTTNQLEYYNKDLEKKLIKKMNIAKDMLDIIAHSYKLIKANITNITDISNNKAELTILNNIVNTTHRLYSELVGDYERKSKVELNIKKELGMNP